MKRRVLLRAVAAGGAGLLAGCVGGEDGAGATDSPTRSPTDSPTESPTDASTASPTADDATDSPGDDPTDSPTERPTSTPETTPDSRELTDRSFEVRDRSCGDGTNRASVDRGDDRVVVEGTIDGRNGCYTAELAQARYDDGGDELTVDVRSDESDEGGMCTQCITDIDYRATFEFDGGTPDVVTVRHDGERVTSE